MSFSSNPQTQLVFYHVITTDKAEHTLRVGFIYFSVAHMVLVLPQGVATSCFREKYLICEDSANLTNSFVALVKCMKCPTKNLAAPRASFVGRPSDLDATQSESQCAATRADIANIHILDALTV